MSSTTLTATRYHEGRWYNVRYPEELSNHLTSNMYWPIGAPGTDPRIDVSPVTCERCGNWSPIANKPARGECAWLGTLWHNHLSITGADEYCSEHYIAKEV